MLKHKKIIEKLTVKQKIALLTDIKCLSSDEFVELGIPYTSLKSLGEVLSSTGEGITENILSRSWDCDTIEDLAGELTDHVKEEGVNFVIGPSPKIKINPYSAAISEDPYLSRMISGAYLRAIHGTGTPSCLSGFMFNSSEIEYLDTMPDRRVLYEYFIYPFRVAASIGDCHSVLASVSGPGENYGDLNLKMMLSAENGLFHVNMNVLCVDHTPEATAEVWHAGGIVMEGVASVLELAYEKYNHIIKSIQEGNATVSDLEDSYSDGSAISDEMIDAAVSRVIDFAFSCQKERGEDNNVIRRQANKINTEDTAASTISQIKNKFKEKEEEDAPVAVEETVNEAPVSAEDAESEVAEPEEETVNEQSAEAVEEAFEEISEEATEGDAEDSENVQEASADLSADNEAVATVSVEETATEAVEETVEEIVEETVEESAEETVEAVEAPESTAEQANAEETVEAVEDSVSTDNSENTTEESAEEDEEHHKAFASRYMFKAIRESVVLLKNERKILPIKQGHRIAIIGDIAMVKDENNESYADHLAKSMKNPLVGMARGYALNEDRDESLIGHAVKLAKDADVVLLFLGIDEKRLAKISMTKQLELPANQAALLEAMKPYSNKTVAVVGGDILPAAKLDSCVGGLLLTHIGGVISARALSTILNGSYNPSGRLTETYYDSPREIFSTLKRYKDEGRNKIGIFMGYRHYDSSDLPVRYPFGYGLSYTTFEYSRLKIKGKTVEFTVENTGKRAGIETAQIYVGKKDSQYIRPAKELKAFIRVELAGYEKKTVSVNVTDLAIYDDDLKEYRLEVGDYEVYVGASVSDIRLTGVMRVNGNRLKRNKDKEKRSDFLQSESNIISDKFTLEAEYQKMKRSWVWKILYIISILALLFINADAIIIANVYPAIFETFGPVIIFGLANVDILLVLLTVFFIIMDVVKSKKLKKAQRKVETDRIKQQFEDAENVESFTVEELFIKEFDEAAANAKVVKAHRGFDLADYSNFVDNDLSFASVCKEFHVFAKDKGIELGESAPASIMSAIASSRFIYTNNLRGESVKKLAAVLSEYFGSPACSEEINYSFMDGSLLYAKDESGRWQETAIAKMINDAKLHKETVHIAAITNVKGDEAANLFSQYIRYFNNPERECKISVPGVDDKCVLPENIWFFVSLAEGERIQNMPIYLAELMSGIEANYTETEAAEEPAEHRSVSYYQINYLAEGSKNRFEMSEDVWKKVDSLEEYIGKHSSYHFGNKLWLRVEKYLAVFCACDHEIPVALDNAINANMLPVTQTALDGKLAEDDRGLLEAIELFLGEENVPVCRRTLNGNTVSEG